MVSFLMVSVQQISCYIPWNDLSFVGKKAWSIKYHIRLVSGEAHLNPYSHRHPVGPFLSHLIFGTLVVFKIMKILILYATGAFPSWDNSLGRQRSYNNFIFQFVFPSCKSLHQLYRARMFLPTAPTISTGIFTDVIWRGSYHPISWDSFVAFGWQAWDLDANSERRLSSRSSWLLGTCVIRAALKLPMGLPHALATRRLPWLLHPLEMPFSIKYYLVLWSFLCFA